MILQVIRSVGKDRSDVAVCQLLPLMPWRRSRCNITHGKFKLNAVAVGGPRGSNGKLILHAGVGKKGSIVLVLLHLERLQSGGTEFSSFRPSKLQWESCRSQWYLPPTSCNKSSYLPLLCRIQQARRRARVQTPN